MGWPPPSPSAWPFSPCWVSPGSPFLCSAGSRTRAEGRTGSKSGDRLSRVRLRVAVTADAWLVLLLHRRLGQGVGGLGRLLPRIGRLQAREGSDERPVEQPPDRSGQGGRGDRRPATVERDEPD